MKRYSIVCVLALCIGSTLQAQELRGTICDTEKQPLIGATVYWAGTTVGATADIEGNFRLHRVKGYDNWSPPIWATSTTRSKSQRASTAPTSRCGPKILRWKA